MKMVLHSKIIEYERIKNLPCNCIGRYSTCLNANCNNFKFLCEFNSNFKYIHSFYMKNDEYINKDLNKIKFIDYKIYNNNLVDKHICIFISLFKYISDIFNDKELGKHFKCFVYFVMYDSLLKNFEYVNFVKHRHINLYMSLIDKFSDDGNFNESVCVKNLNYYNINVQKWKEIFIDL